MIDIENQIYTKIATLLRSKYTDINVGSELLNAPPAFPHVSIVEEDNYTHTRSQDGSSNENNVNVMYEINVYSNKASGKKQECKNIFNTIDNELIDIGFTRISKVPFTNEEGDIYRLVGRYVAVVSKKEIIYRR